MRYVTVWCPDWPVVAAGVRADVPAAVLLANRVVARSPAAAAAGVVHGQRRRPAQQACPDVVLLDHDPDRDARAFEPVVRAVGRFVPRLEVVEPGWLCLDARGPSRYFGGDEQLSERLIAAVVGEAEPARATGVGVGVADGRFASAVAARRAASGERRVFGGANDQHGERRVFSGANDQHGERRVFGGANDQHGERRVFAGANDQHGERRVFAGANQVGGRSIVVPPGGSARFLERLPVAWLQHLGEADAELVGLFARLGLARLGHLAAMPAGDVLARFGPAGRHVHRLAGGHDDRPADATDPPPERRVEQSFDEPVELVQPLVFVGKHLADELVASLGGEGRVCTRLVVTAETEHGERSERAWYRAAGLSAPAMVERVRWQLDGWMSSGELTAGVVLLRLTPDEVRGDDGDQLRLWGGPSAADERAARAVGRLAGLVGDAGVLVPAWQGGRLPADRYGWVPASTTDLTDADDTAERLRPTGLGPWPGSLPAPSPAVVLRDVRPAAVVDEGGQPVRVGGRGELSAPPAMLAVADGAPQEVTGWAGPWPIEERWWEPGRHRRLARFQVVTADGAAHLVVAEHQRWWVAASYD